MNTNFKFTNNKKAILDHINQLLADFFRAKRLQAQKYHNQVYFEIVDQIISLTMLGKDRMRPLLVVMGYQLFAKKPYLDEKEIIKVAVSVEMFHTACLIHDDIMDEGKERRGKPTAIEHFFRKYADWKKARNLAILAGDLAMVWADELFHLANIKQEILAKAKLYFDFLREEVVFGQSLDLSKREFVPRLDILKTYEYKTAKYSFERPLHMGAILAGADDQKLRMLSNFAIKVGVAFQIQDDILGLFGKKDKTKKDTQSDIKEGKETLLILNFKFLISNNKDKKKLGLILGNAKTRNVDIEWVRRTMRKSGALEKTKRDARDLVLRGKKALLEYNKPMDNKAKDFLLELADYSVDRED